MIQFDEQGRPFLLVALDEFAEVRGALVQAGIEFYEDSEASGSCAGPVVGVVRFSETADLVELESTLGRILRP